MRVRLFALAAVLAAALTPAPAFADGADRGKKSIARLFNDTVAKAADSTVRVLVGNKEVALGSVVDPNGLILTKGSELKKGTIFVKLRDGAKYEAEYLGYHEGTDLALLKIDATDLAPVAFAPAKAAEVGNWVAAVGPDSSPLGVGVVSVPERKLYGLDNQIELQNKGYLGINPSREGDEVGGVMVGRVEPAGAAARAGLKPGDVIVKIAGRAVTKFDELRKTLDDYRPGDTVKMVYRRTLKEKEEKKTEEKEIDVKLIARRVFDRGTLQNEMASDTNQENPLSSRRTGFPAVLTHDTVILAKDCGGPVVDLDGRVLGLNIARAGRVETWALTGDVIRPVLADLKAGKFPAPGKPVKVNADDKK